VSGAALWIGVGLLGGAGAVARFAVDAAVSARARPGFPVGTLVVNGSGSLLLGLLVGLDVTGDALLLAGTAVLGSYTTFSTWMAETHRLGATHRRGAATVNVALSLAVGLTAAALGRWAGGAL
jgi:fluoride exporter